MVVVVMVMVEVVIVVVMIESEGDSVDDDDIVSSGDNSGGGDEFSDYDNASIGYEEDEEGGVTGATASKVSKSWMNLALFIKKHNLTDCATEELIKLLREHNEKDVLPSSTYKLKKAFHLNVDVRKYCGVCYKEVTEMCQD